MSRFFPHPPYAEDQTLFRTILASHVLHRGFQAGAIAGILSGSVRSLWSLRGSKAAMVWPLVRSSIVRHAGVGAAVGTGLLSLGLGARMMGKTEIEWQDRSWRLLENQGQLEVDDRSLVGGTVGTLAVVLRRPSLEVLGWKRILGGASIGSVVGVAGYMGWRYMIHGGHREEKPLQ